MVKWAENVEQWDKRGNNRQERHREAPFRACYTSRMLESALEIGEHRAPGIGQKQQTEVRRKGIAKHPFEHVAPAGC